MFHTACYLMQAWNGRLGEGLTDRLNPPSKADGSGQRNNLAPVPIDGRPRFAKRSIDDSEKVKIAAIDPDFA